MVVTAVVSSVLAALLAFTAVRKLSHQDTVVADYRRVGVPENRLNALAVVLLAGATGLIVGLWWTPAGVAAGIGLVCYFVLAVAAHIRARDTGNLPVPLVYLALAVTALVLHTTHL
jgi:hypothetical protein